MKGCGPWIGLGIVAIVALAIIGAIAGGDEDSPEAARAPGGSTPGFSSRRVTAGDFGEKWPLTVDAGVLRCEPHAGKTSQVTFMDGNGTIYAVNGIASGTGRFQDIDVIWAPATDGVGLKKNISPLIDAGLALCH